jgi:uncharacterized protein YndB with AHSA1/START domain
MTASHHLVSVTRSVSVAAPTTTVWEAVSRPGELGAWLGGQVDLDVRPGGVGTATLPDGERSILVTATEPEHRLSWLWWRQDGDVSSVEISLEPAGDATVLTVIERSCTLPDASASARSGTWAGAAPAAGASAWAAAGGRSGLALAGR